MKMSRFAGCAMSNPPREDGNDEIAALPVGMSVQCREEVLGGFIAEKIDGDAMASEESVRRELGKLYAENPALFVEHLRKKAQAKAKKTVEIARHLGLTPTAATKFIAAKLRS